jgi:serine/threonine-protein kinase
MPATIGHYRITRKLGEGGMGVVYEARDERLDRSVAIKMIRNAQGDAGARERLLREARAAASVNHQGICHLYEIGEENGELYLAMELLEGESLAARIARGAVPLAEALQILIPMLSALEALHARGLVHRDLKPSNIFLTPAGAKLLDFGVARRIEGSESETRLTAPGVLIGTPQYLAPEQLVGEPAGPRSDIFAAGIVAYEMLTGRPPFAGRAVTEVIHAIMYEQPPVLGGAPAVSAADRVIHRALAKRPEDRYTSAQEMADDLQTVLLLLDDSSRTAPRVRPMTRLIVLPFRVLRADPETDFLAFGLPDALTSSLSGLDALVVRSSLTASRFGPDGPDLETIAAKADVDVVLSGTLLRAGDQVRVTAQLIEVPRGTVLWSQTSQVQLGDVLQLQDALRDRIVTSLALPLSARDRRMLTHDSPASAKAYELYLRANRVAYEATNRLLARDLYLQCLQEDPHYAPAWARLGRIYRVIAIGSGTGGDDDYRRAQEAFSRALELNPDLSIAHNLYTYLEVETGRAKEAMLRLLERASHRPADPELFAGLVQACRYCGLLDPAIAAYEQAHRLDREIRTSVSHAYLMSGAYERAIATDVEDPRYVTAIAFALMGQPERGLGLLRRYETPGLPRTSRLIVTSTCALLDGRITESSEATNELLQGLDHLRDPCGRYYIARQLAALRDERALAMLRRAVEGGFFCSPFFTRDPWLDSLRADVEFLAIVEAAEARYRDAVAAFRAADGERILRPVSGP